jgi:TonB family protein
VTYGSSGARSIGSGPGGGVGYSPDGDPAKPGERALRAVPGYEGRRGVSGRDADRIRSTQAPINPALYEVDAGGMMEVIRVAEKSSGRVKSTKEILAEPALDLARGVKGEGIGASGFVPVRPSNGDLPDIQAGPGLAGLFGTQSGPVSMEDMEKRAPKAGKEYVGRRDDRPAETVVAGPKTTLFITGQISGRKRLRSGLPKYPQWAIDQGASGLVRVAITVAPDGSVRENVILDASSGYSLLDDAVKTVVRAWQFVPLDATAAQVDQTGTVSIKFVLE